MLNITSARILKLCFHEIYIVHLIFVHFLIQSLNDIILRKKVIPTKID
jgi:hypothetical protein